MAREYLSKFSDDIQRIATFELEKELAGTNVHYYIFAEKYNGYRDALETYNINVTSGGFTNYPKKELIKFNDNFLENVEKEINAGRDTEYINSILEGGSEYKSTEIYINSLKNLLRI